MNIWEDPEGELATEPIDSHLNSNSSLLFQKLEIIMQIKDKIKGISDLGFDAVDGDGSNSLDDVEMA